MCFMMASAAATLSSTRRHSSHTSSGTPSKSSLLCACTSEPIAWNSLGDSSALCLVHHRGVKISSTVVLFIANSCRAIG